MLCPASAMSGQALGALERLRCLACSSRAPSGTSSHLLPGCPRKRTAQLCVVARAMGAVASMLAQMLAPLARRSAEPCVFVRWPMLRSCADELGIVSALPSVGCDADRAPMQRLQVVSAGLWGGRMLGGRCRRWHVAQGIRLLRRGRYLSGPNSRCYIPVSRPWPLAGLAWPSG